MSSPVLPVRSGSSRDLSQDLGEAASSASATSGRSSPVSRTASPASVAGEVGQDSALARTDSKVADLVPDAVMEGAAPASGRKSRNPVKRYREWRHSIVGNTSALAAKTPSQSGRDATKLAETSEKAVLKSEKSILKDDKKGRVDVVAKWETASVALATAKDSWELAQDEWISAGEKIEADMAGFQSDLALDPTNKKLSGQVRELAGKKIRAEKMAREAGEKVAAFQAKADEADVKLAAAREVKAAASKGAEDSDAEGLELKEGDVSGASQSASEDEEVEESGEYGDGTLQEPSDPSLISKGDVEATDPSKLEEGGRSEKCNWLQTSAMVAVAVGFVFAAFGALCLAGVLPLAFSGGLVGAITVTSVSALLTVAGLGLAIWQRNHAQAV